ncbi:MAG: class II aldolase/adducin family protein [Deltaproteobacteria bacterium]|nr:class II aldolase/adducin family protein [Deltaproteobacteria bacterium]
MKEEDFSRLKEKMAIAITILTYELADMWGHVSVRGPDSKHFLLRHLRPPGDESVPPDDVLEFDLGGKRTSGRRERPDEIFFYVCPYRVKKEVGSVIHCHPPMALALTAAGQKIIPIHQDSVNFGKHVPVAPWLYGYWRDHGEKAVKLMGDNCALMIMGHGALVVGKTIEEACMNMVHLERTAKMILQARGSAKLRSISPSVAKRLLSVAGSGAKETRRERRSGGPALLEWSYYESMVKRGERWSRL